MHHIQFDMPCTSLMPHRITERMHIAIHVDGVSETVSEKQPPMELLFIPPGDI